ncbi:two-component regulator propeller domain-containing protein [Clostridium sp.]|uniref:two-component regulator propeller domain-containing protein n=1 Tax=Clostridium sp. TaxID=1506 RepID=UPI00262A527D|nr:two-component regulator propeller domain-containing protein [Clostridium sp.]
MLVIDILLTKNIKNDNNSISNNMISSLVEDNDKNLWIGTDGGLNKMNLEEEFIMGFGLIYRR